MSIEYLKDVIEHYGYVALFVGTFLEGETILLLAGFVAQSPQFNLNITTVILTAFAGSLAGDQLAFFIGRRYAQKLIRKSEKWESRVARVHAMLKKYHEILILSFRFFYGLRNLTPFVLGSTEIRASKFLTLNAIGALIWAVTFGLIGYAFGSLVETMLARVIANVHHVELLILAVLALVALIFWARKFCRKK